METQNLTSIDQLLIKSWGIFTKVWLKYVALFVITIFGSIGILFLTLGQAITRNIILDNSGDAVLNNETLSRIWPFLVIGLVLLLLFAAVMGLAMNKIIYSEAEGKPEEIKASLEFGLKNSISYFLVTLLTGLITVLGFILFVIPGVYAAVILSFVPVVFVMEEKHALNALKRSKELVRGRFWPVFSRVFVLFALTILISAVTRDAPVLSFITSMITGPISIAYIYFIYKDLVTTA